jgi:hypothetical protein
MKAMVKNNSPRLKLCNSYTDGAIADQ